jgi:hypothetical protein
LEEEIHGLSMPHSQSFGQEFHGLAREAIAWKLPRDRARCGECDRAILFVRALDCAAVEIAVWQILYSKLPEHRSRLTNAARARQRDAEFDVDERVVRSQRRSLVQIGQRGGIAPGPQLLPTTLEVGKTQ